MRSWITAAATAAATMSMWSAPAAAADVGVSVQISQPGVYGRIDIGRFPQPQVIVAQPVVVTRPVAVAPPQPVYMWVPPGHRKNWKKHCRDYGACGVPVYFVRHDWYDQQVHPRGKRGYRDDDRRGHPGKGNGKGRGRDD
ncbi:MAG: hypothetical protein KF683_25670 [Rubrivivax sp.]|nr:hypothetical protein [Rubrivivax sp.]MBX3638777.1 hypothetical protein [Rubrivivax sp.]